jgi:hypothetical protein
VQHHSLHQASYEIREIRSWTFCLGNPQEVLVWIRLYTRTGTASLDNLPRNEEEHAHVSIN